ncbi:MAG: hypothetical protein IT304_09980 [Dehalococcoidia bacterium]|nr:hypothetical protein [Dehalococcoidia bacterium]
MRRSRECPACGLLRELLAEERARVERLLAQLERRNEPAPPAEPAYNWPALQPLDEALEDVQTMVQERAMSQEEAERILDQLGFSNTTVEIIDP